MQNQKNLNQSRIEHARQEGLGGHPEAPQKLQDNENWTHAKKH